MCLASTSSWRAWRTSDASSAAVSRRATPAASPSPAAAVFASAAAASVTCSWVGSTARKRGFDATRASLSNADDAARRYSSASSGFGGSIPHSRIPSSTRAITVSITAARAQRFESPSIRLHGAFGSSVRASMSSTASM